MITNLIKLSWWESFQMLKCDLCDLWHLLWEHAGGFNYVWFVFLFFLIKNIANNQYMSLRKHLCHFQPRYCHWVGCHISPSGRFHKQTNRICKCSFADWGMWGVWTNRSSLFAASSSQAAQLRWSSRERWGETVSQSFQAACWRSESKTFII